MAMTNILLFGPPGAGKGTQAELIQKQFPLLHLSTGEAIRSMIARETPLGKLAQEQMKGGKLASDEIVCNIIEQYVIENIEAEGIIFDGFPRTLPQAEELDSIMNRANSSITAMIAMIIPDEMIIDRIQGRAKVSGRADDSSIEVIRGRIATYRAQTEIVAEFYKAQGKYYEVDGTKSIEEVSKEVIGLIEKLKK